MSINAKKKKRKRAAEQDDGNNVASVRVGPLYFCYTLQLTTDLTVVVVDLLVFYVTGQLEKGPILT